MEHRYQLRGLTVPTTPNRHKTPGCYSILTRALLDTHHSVTKSVVLTAIASPFVAMSQSFSKQANTLWYEIFDVVKDNSLVDYSGPTPADNVMERLLQARS